MWVGSDRESCLCGSFNHSYEAFLLFPLASHRALPGSESVSGIFLSVLAYVYKSLLAKMDSSTEVYVTSFTMGWCPLPFGPLRRHSVQCSQEGLLDLRNEKYVVSFFCCSSYWVVFFFLFYFFLFFNWKKMLHNTELFLCLLSQLLPLSYLGVSSHREHIYLPSQWKITSVSSEYPTLGITQAKT